MLVFNAKPPTAEVLPAATETPVGAIQKSTRHFLVGAGFTAVGTLVKTGRKALTAVFTASGQLARSITFVLTGTITPAGNTARAVLWALTGTFTAVGNLAKTPGKVLAAALANSGALSRQTQHQIAASITPLGSTLKQVIYTLQTGVFGPQGALQKARAALLTASTTPLGALARTTGKSLSASISGIGTLARTTAHILASASESAVGTVFKNTTSVLSGIFTGSGFLSLTHVHLLTFTAFTAPLGNLLKAAGKRVSGSIAIVGTMARETIHTLLAGILLSATSFNSSLQATGQHAITLLASLMPAGTQVKQTARTLTAVFAPLATLSRIIGTAFTGAFTSTAGIIASLTLTQILTASITAVGSVSKNLQRQVTASLSNTGAFSKTLVQIFSAVFTPTASLTKALTLIAFTGLERAGGVFVKTFQDLPFTAALTAVGTFVKAADKAFAGSTVQSASLRKGISQILNAALITTVGFVKLMVTALFAGILTTGGAFTKTADKALTGIQSLLGNTTRTKLLVFLAGLGLNAQTFKNANKQLTALLAVRGRIESSLAGLIAFVGNLLTHLFLPSTHQPKHHVTFYLTDSYSVVLKVRKRPH